MNIEELYEGIDDTYSITQRYLGLSLKKFFILFFMVLAFGIHLGVIMYGTNSLEVLFNLQDYEQYLNNETLRLKNENADLQKEYFELRDISVK